MMTYVGIDLGTTNSAMAIFDGVDVKIFKSPEQHDVTPSVLYVDRRKTRFFGARAYANQARDPANGVTGFKRMMGTSARFQIPNLEIELTPEACSAELLKLLFGYLPEEMRDSPDTATMITVPAAFDQMQKDATLQAAQMAQLGRVALMQEPVAAVMAVMRKRPSDGVFLIYDLGGGTLDVAVARSIAGSVELLQHGGLPVCGGRDMDRRIVDGVVYPWLREHFAVSGLPSEHSARLHRLAAFAAEQAKIQLSQNERSTISMDEAELGVRDADGREIYLDVEIDRRTFDRLIDEQIQDSVAAARSTLEQAGLTSMDVERVVFVGGPTQYGPLRHKVSRELGIPASTEVNPMTAVAEGAAIFAESLDWSKASAGRKASRGRLTEAELGLSFAFTSRTPAERARIAIELRAEAPSGTEFQIDASDTGWSSGRLPLRDRITVDVPLALPGDNRFRARLFDPLGAPIHLTSDQILITRAAASIGGIPASHTIGVEARESLGGPKKLDILVRKGDPLPAKGQKVYHAEIGLSPGEARSIRFKLFEGEFHDSIFDNKYIGAVVIDGSDLSDQPLAPQAELILDYEVSEAGNIMVEVSAPEVALSVRSGRNFYSRQDAQLDLEDAREAIKSRVASVHERIESLASIAPAADLGDARNALVRAQEAAATGRPEDVPHANQLLQGAVEMLLRARQASQLAIREHDLTVVSDLFNSSLRSKARDEEIAAFDAAGRAAEQCLHRPNSQFEEIVRSMWSHAWAVLWRQDDFVVERFDWLASSPHLFLDKSEYNRALRAGSTAKAQKDMRALRHAVSELENMRLTRPDESEMMMAANILKK